MAHLKWVFTAFLFFGFFFDGFGQDIADTTLVREYLDSTQIFKDSEHYDRALEYGKKALELCLQKLGEQDSTTATAYFKTGVILQKMGMVDEALAMHLKAFEIRVNTLPREHADISRSSATIGSIYYDKGKYKIALKYYEESLEKLEILEKNNIDRIKYNINLANIYAVLGKHEKALQSFQQALGIGLSVLGKNHYIIAAIYNNIGAVYEKKGKNDFALQYYRKTLNTGVKFKDEGVSYNNMGVIYMIKSEYDKALEYFQLALDFRLKSLDKDHPLVGASYNNIGLIYQHKEEYEKAMIYHEKSLGIRLKSLNELHPDIARSYFNIGETYDGQGNYRKALEYHKKALDIRIKGLGESHPYVAAGYNSIGEIYFKQGRHDTALEYCQKALNILLNSFGKNHLDVALYYNNIANIYEKKRDYDLAIKNHKIALSISLKELGKGHPNVAESYNRLGEIYYKLKNYEKAVEYNEKAIDCLQQMRKHFTTIESKQFHLSEKQSIFENSIRNILEANSFDSTQFDLKQTFTYAETGKGNLLLDALNSSQAKYFANIPEPLLQKEYDLITDITYYDKKRQEKLLEGMDENDTTILAFSSKQFGLNRQYEVLVNQLETDYPQYYQAKYNFTTLTVNHVQDHLLAENQTLLEYFVGDSSIFIFLIQKNNYEVKEIKRDFPLKDWVQQMTKEGIYGYHALSIYDPLKTDSLQDAATLNYATAAQNLYKKLISPFENKLTKNLLIIPDGVLNYLPFEALLTEAPARIGSYKSYPYMLKKHQISYSYSATLLDEMRQKQHRRAPERKLLAMAPFFDGDMEELNIRIDTTDIFADINRSEPLLPLPNSGEEIATISKLFDGTPIYGTAASLTQFQQQAESYRILHLATHGKADDRVGDYAYLAFAVPGDVGEFDKLYARDLYNYSLNADMVVLSACETGTGKLQKGEGIISLSRAFAYAGAKSIFPTLWQVSDEKTKDLLIGFYKYLKIGKPKDEALRLAKLDFLESNAGNGIGTHPYFWAGLIGIGDMRAVR